MFGPTGADYQFLIGPITYTGIFMRIAMLSFLILIGHISAQVYRGNTLLINSQRVDTGLMLRLRDSGFLRVIDPVGTIEVSSKNPVTGIVNFLPKDDRFWSWRWQIRSLIGLKLSLDTVSSIHFTNLKVYLLKQKQWYQEKIQGFSLDLRSISEEGALQFLEGIDSDFDKGLGELVLVMPGFSLVSISEDRFSRLSRKNLLIVDVTGMDEELIQNLSLRLNQADFTFQLLIDTNSELRTKSGIKVESPMALSHHPFRVHRVISASETLQYELIPRKPLVDSVLGDLGLQMFLYTRFSEEFIENRYKMLLKLPQKGLSGVAVESSGADLRTLLPGYKTREPRVHLTQNQKSVWLEISSESETLEFSGSKYRLYTFTDLFQLKISKVLRQRGFSIQKLRKTIEALRSLLPQVSHPLIELTFLVDEDKILVFNGDVVMDEKATENYIKFRVRELREDVDKLFPSAGTGATAGEFAGRKIGYA